MLFSANNLANRLWTQTDSFTGKSFKLLQDILLNIDTNLQSEEEFKQAEDKALHCFKYLKAELENKIPPTIFECIIVGSVAERYGTPCSYMDSVVPAFISGEENSLPWLSFCTQDRTM